MTATIVVIRGVMRRSRLNFVGTVMHSFNKFIAILLPLKVLCIVLLMNSSVIVRKHTMSDIKVTYRLLESEAQMVFYCVLCSH